MDVEAQTVVIETNKGTLEAQLDAAKAPVTVKNFLTYANEKYFDGTIFHRVIPGFMVQGGGFTEAMEQKKNHGPIKIESDNGLKNDRGTLAMARTNDPNSATSQFFINLVDNAFLNSGAQGPGYTVFGKLTKGIEVIDEIAKVKTATKNGHENVPVEAVVIKSITVKK